ncbi:response regulator transcription factor [Dactylosporangium matsuzakiense]|uniref:DNA-binding response regulator n=1 Tax=Dactylosporangium matsuzakiense TaxID=53360 RepID=A0A9W6NQN2_9ACTN|nr:response regulator transcription factor [Dactylosporangium matsuzakiense]GLL06385.1 DNA-binding response regulator [Dactylosporangium matsuzakiense]
MSAVRLLVVDDHPIVREGLRAVLDREPDLTVEADCGSGREAVRLAAALRPDVVLMDLRLPDLDGIDAIERITAGGTARVLVLTSYDTDGDVVRAVAAGAVGYLLKGCSREELTAAVRTAAKGGTALAGPAAGRLARHRRGDVPQLTNRELDVLRCLARGLSNPETGRELFVSEATVKTHVMRIFDKLDVKDRTAAVTTAIARGLLPRL